MIPVLPDALSRWVAGVLIVAFIGGVVGWRIRARIGEATERHLESEVEFLSSKVDAYRANTVVLKRSVADLEAALSEQSDSITALGESFNEVVRREKEARKALAEYLARPTPAPLLLAGTCESMVEQVRIDLAGRL